MESVLNEKMYSEDFLKKSHEEFMGADGFPHIVIDDFLQEDIANTLYENFPTSQDMRRSYKNLNENKSEGSGFDKYHPLFAQLKDEIRSEKFRTAFTKLTGIENLEIPDDFRGSGVHQGFNGSYLDVHVDFSIHPTLKKHRRLNLLIFLNKNWKEEYGGHCEFWNEDVTEMIGQALPSFNRAVIFRCSRTSFHGYDTINVPEGESRKSFYSYFYTDVAPGVEYHDTIFKARPSEGRAKKIKTDMKEGSKNFVKRILYKMNMKGLFNKYE